MRTRVVEADRLGPVRTVAGVDAHHVDTLHGADGTTWGAVVLLALSDLAVRERRLVGLPTRFPYVPGLLSFREAPAVLAALDALAAKPDLLLVDGHGRAHPRRFGIACHVGVLAGIPTIGIGKSRLTGRYEAPGAERGAWTPLVARGEVIGAALRTRPGTRPIFVSVGHRISLETAIDYALRLTPRFRLPEPIRQADRLSREHPSAADGRGGCGVQPSP